MNIIFFGSSTDSVIVLDTLHKKFPVSCVITQPAKPVGREKIITPTPVATWAKNHTVPVLSFPQDAKNSWKFARDEDVVNSVETFKPDLIVTACFGQKIPAELIGKTPHGAINVHPSILPRWRGGDPVPWTILAGDAQTGVTITTVTKNFDDGKILAQKKIPVTEKISTHELRTELFTLGAHLLIETLPDYLSGKNKGVEQNNENATVARRLNRDDGFVEWNEFVGALEKNAPELERKYRAFFPWPGLWTKISIHGVERRLKIVNLLTVNGQLLPQVVQLEGKKPVDWKTFEKAYLR